MRNVLEIFIDRASDGLGICVVVVVERFIFGEFKSKYFRVLTFEGFQIGYLFNDDSNEV